MTNILTAQEFIAQGTSAGAIMSIAAANPQYGDKIREVAMEVSRITGQSPQIPGAVTASREAARRAANDNRRGRRVAG